MIRKATPDDARAVWRIIEPIIRAGETYAIDRDMGRAEALEYWMGEGRQCYVAEHDGKVLGTYYLRRNHAGGGAHICNCGYIVSPSAGGQGLAGAMCEHSLRAAGELGFTAMQFNFVVANNHRAIALWERNGFETVGRLPEAFDHPHEGLVDAVIMYRKI